MRIVSFTLKFDKTPSNPHGNPPRTTDQQKKIAVVNGKPRKYMTKRLIMAQNALVREIMPYAPDKPHEGPVELIVTWYFYKKVKQIEPKLTRPDTDNMIKQVKDIMTKLGFWKDDAQVFCETTKKYWSNNPGMHIEVFYHEKEGFLYE